MDIRAFLAPYNPWVDQGEKGLQHVPEFTRPVFHDLIGDLQKLPQIISVTGPRRVGKSTLLHQVVRHQLRQGYPPDLLIYYSLDDPALFRPSIQRDGFMEALMLEVRRRAGRKRVFLLLDEIQRLEHWELYLKKYYDLRYPVRLVVSGSASSPIFKKSRESLLGRVKDYHLLPFSFREFLLYRVRDDRDLFTELEAIYQDGTTLRGKMVGDPRHLDLRQVTIRAPGERLWRLASQAFEDYLREGGFPEVWEMETWDQKVEYLYDNQVKKVIYEDLVLAAEFRKPELLKRFYISLLEQPGREVNLSRIAEETGVLPAQAEKYLPLLEMTDLVAHVEKFRKSALRLRRGNIKFYLIDLALRNAVLRVRDAGLSDPTTLGMYAENLVFNALRKWRGTVAFDYYRERDEEVDFIVHLGPRKYLPFEVKYRENTTEGDLRPIRNFMRRFRAPLGIVVCKRAEDCGPRDGLFLIPLLHFLLMFD
ncbi:MAG: ATP-binding protein [Deltaproteobacteria bacterium]|nr:ATP-binding protein [Deltaproteobacteria bacterium]MBI3076079.1 ATP-binding protein [Deltaproteobacteria bacterium]